MIRTVTIVMLSVAATLAQTKNPTPRASASARTAINAPAATPKPSGRAAVSPTTPVMTIHGLCDSQSKQGPRGGSCATVLTRRQFEAFLDVLSATSTRDIDPASYSNVAAGYAMLLMYADAGQKAGAANDPRFGQVLEGARLRALGEMYQVQRLDEARRVSPEEIEAYYKKNIADYEEVGLDRLILPKNNPMNLSDPDFRARAKRLADELHARAVKGEDISKLEKEGLAALGLKDAPIIAVAVRRGQFGDEWNNAVLALGPGQVTPVLETTAVWAFYKRTSRQTLPLELVRGEIFGKLRGDKIETLNKSLHDAVKVDYNEAYFGPAPGKAKPEGNPTREAALGPRDVVMTIHGLCDSHKPGQEARGGSCTMTVTREQFDTVLKVITAGRSQRVPVTPRSVAEGYLEELIFGKAAQRAGIENDPRSAAVLELARKRALGDMYRVKVDEEAHQVPAEGIEAYYKKNLAGFEELRLRHLTLPKDEKSNLADLAKLAGELRARAVKGADLDKLQKEAFDKLGVKGPASTLMPPLRRGAMEARIEQEVFALKPGQVTTVLDIPTARLMYKLESRRTIPLEEAKAEISQTLYLQKLENLVKARFASVQTEYNDDYFASAAPSGGWVSARK